MHILLSKHLIHFSAILKEEELMASFHLSVNRGQVQSSFLGAEKQKSLSKCIFTKGSIYSSGSRKVEKSKKLSYRNIQSTFLLF